MNFPHGKPPQETASKRTLRGMPFLDCETGHGFSKCEDPMRWLLQTQKGSFSLVPNFNLCHRSPLLFVDHLENKAFSGKNLFLFFAPFPNLWRGWGRWRRRQFPNSVLDIVLPCGWRVFFAWRSPIGMFMHVILCHVIKESSWKSRKFWSRLAPSFSALQATGW